MTEPKKCVHELGALTSDLIVGIYALATEGETGEHLAQRISELRATMNAIDARLDAIAENREASRK